MRNVKVVFGHIVNVRGRRQVGGRPPLARLAQFSRYDRLPGGNRRCSDCPTGLSKKSSAFVGSVSPSDIAVPVFAAADRGNRERPCCPQGAGAVQEEIGTIRTKGLVRANLSPVTQAAPYIFTPARSDAQASVCAAFGGGPTEPTASHKF